MDYMKNKFEMVVVALDDCGMQQERQDFFVLLSLLAEELLHIRAAAADKIKESVDADSDGDIQPLVQLRYVAQELSAEVEALKSASKYKNADYDKLREHSLRSCKLTDDMVGKIPWKIVVEGKRYILEKRTWRCLYLTVLSVLHATDAGRFAEFTEHTNAAGTSFCRFATDASVFSDGEPIYLAEAGVYVKFQGDAKTISYKTLQAFQFFNLQNDYELFVADREVAPR